MCMGSPGQVRQHRRNGNGPPWARGGRGSRRGGGAGAHMFGRSGSAAAARLRPMAAMYARRIPRNGRRSVCLYITKRNKSVCDTSVFVVRRGCGRSCDELPFIYSSIDESIEAIAKKKFFRIFLLASSL
jgi:hypothetical protein